MVNGSTVLYDQDNDGNGGGDDDDDDGGNSRGGDLSEMSEVTL